MDVVAEGVYECVGLVYFVPSGKPLFLLCDCTTSLYKNTLLFTNQKLPKKDAKVNSTMEKRCENGQFLFEYCSSCFNGVANVCTRTLPSLPFSKHIDRMDEEQNSNFDEDAGFLPQEDIRNNAQHIPVENVQPTEQSEEENTEKEDKVLEDDNSSGTKRDSPEMGTKIAPWMKNTKRKKTSDHTNTAICGATTDKGTPCQNRHCHIRKHKMERKKREEEEANNVCHEAPNPNSPSSPMFLVPIPQSTIKENAVTSNRIDIVTPEAVHEEAMTDQEINQRLLQFQKIEENNKRLSSSSSFSDSDAPNSSSYESLSEYEFYQSDSEGSVLGSDYDITIERIAENHLFDHLR